MGKSQLVNAIADQGNRTARTANGAVTLHSTKDSVLDFYSRGAAYRTHTDKETIDLFERAFSADAELATKCLFYIRDIRGGQGERKVFRTILRFLAYNHKATAIKNFAFIASLGRWDDFFAFHGTPVETEAFSFMQEQWRADIEILREGGDRISLLGKWAPSANTSSKETKMQAIAFYTFLGLSEKLYRKTLTNLRAKLKIVEGYMSRKDWTSIEYGKMPSRASLKYRSAFGKKDTERYAAYLAALTKGEAKVNAATLYPYDLVHPIITNKVSAPRSNDAVLMDAQWKALPSYMAENEENTLVVIDTSSSMHSPNYMPLASSIGIGLYLAEHNKGIFKDCFITFEDVPKMHQVQGKNLYDKVKAIQRATWGGSTNLQATFDLILAAAIQNGLPESEMPQRLFIISDMEFNRACEGHGEKTNFEEIDRKYRAAKYERPLLVFWNVNATNNQSPVKFDERGTMLVSGRSPSIFKSVMESKVVTPYEMMVEVLSAEKYAGIHA